MIHIRGSCAQRGCNCVCFCVTNFISIQIAVTQNVEEYLSADDGNMCQEGSYYTTHRAAYLFSVYIFCCLPCASGGVFVLMWKEGMAQCQRQSCPLDIMINTKLAMAFNQFRNKLFVQSTALVLMPHATTETFEANERRVWQRPDIRQQ